MYNDGSELNPTTGWYEMFFRSYDPALGRMMAVDPLAVKYNSLSPYHYALDNPALVNDPTGAEDSHKESYDGETCPGCFAGVVDSNNSTGCKFCNTGPTSGNTIYDLYARSISGQYYNSGLPTVYNNWCNCEVNAFEIINYDPTNQNAEYRMKAYNAIFDYYERKSQEAAQQTQGGPSDWYGRLGELFEKNYNGGVAYDGDAWYGTNFIGPGPNENPYRLKDKKTGQYLKPKDMIDAAAQRHDFFYYLLRAEGIKGALFATRVGFADQILATEASKAFFGYFRGDIDPITGNPISPRTRDVALE